MCGNGKLILNIKSEVIISNIETGPYYLGFKKIKMNRP